MRVDAAVETGSVVGTDYDSMIAKVIAHGPDRATALARLDRALAETAILGLETNVGFLRTLLARDDVRAGEMDTGLIGRLDPVTPPLTDEEVARAAASLALGEPASDDPFDRRDGWRLGGVRAPSYWKLAVNGGEPIDVVLARTLKRAWPAYVVGGRLARVRGLDVARDRGDGRGRPSRARRRRAARADARLRAARPGQRSATRSRPARRSSCSSR